MENNNNRKLLVNIFYIFAISFYLYISLANFDKNQYFFIIALLIVIIETINWILISRDDKDVSSNILSKVF